MNIDKKLVLDKLYIAKAGLAETAHHENVKSYQLPENDVSGRNLASGRSDAFVKANSVVDKIIREIIEMPEI